MTGIARGLVRALKILILKPSSLGDMVHALPILRLLKQEFPRSQLHWWLDDRLAPLLADDPDLAAVALFHRRAWLTQGGLFNLVRTALALRRQQFDWVIDLQALARSAWMAWFAGGSLTVGLDSCRDGAAGFYDLAIARPHPDAHAVEWNLAVLRALGVPTDRTFQWLPQRSALAEEVRRRRGHVGARLILLCPGARWENKQWPVDYFIALLESLAKTDATLRFAILGGQEDQSLGRILSARQPERCLDLTGQTTLPELVEWLRQGDLLVTNDSGPMHLAAALGKPIVALFGPTHPGRTGPWRAQAEVLQTRLSCVPCLKRTCANDVERECLRTISPESVAGAVRKMLAPAGTGECG